MGSIVKTIGKTVKKIGKALKKIAPILLVAAVAYIGYGYMTGGGGWTQATDWGKSLIGGVSQGQTLSQAATAAGGMETFADAQTFPASGPGNVAGTDLISEFVPPTDATLTPMGTPFEYEGGPEADISADPSLMTDAGLLGTEDGMGLPSEGGLLAKIQENTNNRSEALLQGLADNLDSTNLSPTISNFYMSDATASSGTAPGSTYDPKLGGMSPAYPGLWPPKKTAIDGMGFPGSTPTQSGVTTPIVPPVDTYDIGEIPHPKTGNYFVNAMQNAFGNTFGKAWGVYKGLWKDNAYLAMYGTSKIIQLVMAAMDDSEEKESYRRRHVAGFAPGNWSDLRKKHGGNLPTSKLSGIWAGEGRRQSSVKTGPKTAGGMRTSTIDRKPQGLVGSKNQGAY